MPWPSSVRSRTLIAIRSTFGVAALLVSVALTWAPEQAAAQAQPWCVVQRDSVSGSTPIKEFAAAKCDTVGMFGAGWIVLRRWATFAEAQTDRAAMNGANMPPVWCLLRRDSGMTGTEFSVARCDQPVGGWIVQTANLTFTEAHAARAFMAAAMKATGK